MASSQAYGIYWGTCSATVITWVFAMIAFTDDAWISKYAVDTVQVGGGCIGSDAFCDRFYAATAFQFMATIVITFALVVMLMAAFSSPPTTGRLGLALGIMLAVFSLFEMLAFSIMAGHIAEYDDSEVVASSTLAVAVMAWIFGLTGAITILALRSRATSDQGGPFRMPGGGGVAKGASAGQHVGTV